MTTIIVGLLSRRTDIIPLCFGDLFYATMIYFIIHFLLIEMEEIKIMLLALLFCSCIEFLQLYDANWMVAIRHTLMGKYILGQGFLWSDIIAYIGGILLAFGLDKYIIKK